MSDQVDATPGADADEEHPLVGHVLADRYRIEALLGEGGMGAVFRATHLSLERPVAVKILHPRLTDDEHVSKRFEREALAVSKLDHPGCVQVIDFGTTSKGMKYLVMQFLDGRELRELTGVGLPVAQVVDFGSQILRALEHAHKRGLVHRDLKPENIFLVDDDDGETVVKLVDFGIVKLVESSGLEKLTRKGMAFGTPTYMSPEQAAGGSIDPRTDLYSVGVLLYEMLTGIPPFDADEPGILLRMHILADPPPLPDTVPAALSKVVLKLLEKEADDRYQSAKETRRALKAALEGAPASPASDSVSIPNLVGGGGAGAAHKAPTDADDPEQTAAEPVVPAAPPDDAAASTSAASDGMEPTAAEPVVLARSGGTLEGTRDSAPTSAEPVMPVRSGGTVVAGSSTPTPAHASSVGPAAHPGAAAAVGHATPAPMASASMSHGGAVSTASGSMSHGGVTPTAAGSMSHGAAHGSMAAGVPYDSLSRSGAHGVMAPGATSGVYPAASGAYGVVPPGPAPARRSSSSNNKILLVVVLVLLTWGAIALLWWSMRDDGRPGPGTVTPTPGVYRFTDGDGEAEEAPELEPEDKKNKKAKKDKKNKKGKK